MTGYQLHGLSNEDPDFIGLDRQASILAEITASQMPQVRHIYGRR